MADTNTAAATDNPEQSAPESQAGILTMPGVTDTPPWENPAPDIADASPAPDVADGDVAAPSNIIENLFDVKRAAAQETENQAAEQDTAAQEKSEPAQDAPDAGAEDPEKKGRGGKPPKAEKSEKAPESDKSEKQNRSGKPPKGDKQAADVGGGTSKQGAGKDEPASCSIFFCVSKVHGISI